MPRFSKKEQAICPSCGDWKTTDFTPEELKEKEWECSDCVNKRLTNPELLPENRGSKEITIYDPEYEFLKKLVILVGKTVPEAIPEIKELSTQHPFQTIDDAGDLAAQIWTLAVDKFGIPREWLIKKLPEKKIKSFLKKANIDDEDNGNCDECGLVLTQEEYDAGSTCKECLKPKDWGKKKADLKEYSNEETKGINDFIIQHPKVMEVVIDAAKRATDEKSFTDWLQKALTEEGMEEGIRKAVKWEELGWAWFNTVYRETTEPTSTDVIEKLPTLDKKQKLDELLDQLSAETDPTKKEQIKQHIERIKRAKLLKADLWPAQNETEDMLNHAPGYLAYQYGQQKESAPEQSQFPIYKDLVNDSFYHKGNRWSSVVKELKSLYPQITDEEILQLKQDVKLQLEKSRLQIESKKKSLNIDKVVQVLNSKEPKVVRVDPVKAIIELSDGSIVTFDDAVKKAMELDKEGVFSGAEFSTNDVGVNPSMDSGPWSSPQDSGAGKQVQPWPNTEWLPADDENKDEQPYSNVASNLNKPFSKKALLNKKAYWWSSSSGRIELEMTPDQVASVSGQGQHNEDAKLLVNELRPILNEIDPKIIASELKEYGAWDDAELADHEANLERLVWIAGNDISEYEFEQENKEVEVDIQELPTLDKKQRINELLEQLSIEIDPQKKEKIKQHINRIKMASLYKKANPPSRYWIAPDGKEFEVFSGGHGRWIGDNKNILKQYGIITSNLDAAWNEMLRSGWARISNEPVGGGFQIQVQDMSNISSSLDNFIAKNFQRGDKIRLGDQIRYVTIEDPFPSIQKAVNKQLMHNRASLNIKASIEKTPSGVKVLINPTPNEVTSWFRKYTSLRAVIEPTTGDVYVWDAKEVEHDGIIRYFGLTPDWETDDGTYLRVVSQEGDVEQLFSIQNMIKNKLTKHFKKKADISGNVINDILKGIESSGGITYNAVNGQNMSGTHNYAVSVYQDREKIIDGPVDFDTVEGYIMDNQDLLNDPKNSFGAWINGSQVYLDVVLTVPNKDEALELARKNNQLAIWDLYNNQELKTGIVRAFSKKQLNKKAEDSLLSQDQQNQVAAKWCPAMNLLLNNYAEARKRGHEKDRSFNYAYESIQNIDKSITEKQAIEAINTYL